MPHFFPFIATSSLILCPFVVRLSFLPFHDQTDFLTILHTHQWPPLVHLTLWSILFHILSSSRSGTLTFWLSCFIHHFIGLQRHCLSAEHPYSGFEQLLTKSLPPAPETISLNVCWNWCQGVQNGTQSRTAAFFTSRVTYSWSPRQIPKDNSNPTQFSPATCNHRTLLILPLNFVDTFLTVLTINFPSLDLQHLSYGIQDT